MKEYVIKCFLTFQKHNQGDCLNHLEYQLQQPIRIHESRLYHHDYYQTRQIHDFNKIKNQHEM
jgi:hypothetical protein